MKLKKHFLLAAFICGFAGLNWAGINIFGGNTGHTNFRNTGVVLEGTVDGISDGRYSYTMSVTGAGFSVNTTASIAGVAIGPNTQFSFFNSNKSFVLDAVSNSDANWDDQTTVTIKFFAIGNATAVFTSTLNYKLRKPAFAGSTVCKNGTSNVIGTTGLVPYSQSIKWELNNSNWKINSTTGYIMSTGTSATITANTGVNAGSTVTLTLSHANFPTSLSQTITLVDPATPNAPSNMSFAQIPGTNGKYKATCFVNSPQTGMEYVWSYYDGTGSGLKTGVTTTNECPGTFVNGYVQIAVFTRNKCKESGIYEMCYTLPSTPCTLQQAFPDNTLSDKKVDKGDVFSLYPNPANNFLQVNYPATTSEAHLVLYNYGGSIALDERLSENATQHVVNIDKLTAGVYAYAIIYAGEKKYTGKFIKL